MRGAERRDDGTLSLELAFIAPGLLAVVGLLLTYGRYSQLTGLVEDTARDAARAATQARSYDEAQARVARIGKDDLTQAPASCRDTAAARITSPPGDFAAGSFVTVEVRCRVEFSDVGLAGTPGTKTLVRTFTSPLDPFRGTR